MLNTIRKNTKRKKKTLNVKKKIDKFETLKLRETKKTCRGDKDVCTTHN